MRIGAEPETLARVCAGERIDEPRPKLDDRRTAAGIEIVIGVTVPAPADEEIPVIEELAVDAGEIALVEL